MKQISILPAVLLAASSVLNAQTAPPQASPKVAPAMSTSGAFFALSVPDLEASSKWYAEKLGLKTVMHVPHAGKVAVTVLEGGGLIVELIQNDDAVTLATAAPSVKSTYLVHGIFKSGIIVDRYEETLATLRARGVEFALGPFPARDGQRANVIIRDNSGNMIQIFGK